jgi:hypothetical protein
MFGRPGAGVFEAVVELMFSSENKMPFNQPRSLSEATKAVFKPFRSALVMIGLEMLAVSMLFSFGFCSQASLKFSSDYTRISAISSANNVK